MLEKNDVPDELEKIDSSNKEIKLKRFFKSTISYHQVFKEN